MILTFPEGLSHFTMKDPWSHPSGAPDGWEFDNIIHPREYIKKIKKSSSANLEYLDLDLWHAGSQPDFDSLCCLKHLTTFTMMPEFDQMEWDKGDVPDPIPHLPGSLETLELNDFAGMGISFASLAGRVEAGTLPNLRVVKYRKVYGPDGEETEQEREDWGYEVRSLEILGVKLRQDAVHLTPVG